MEALRQFGLGLLEALSFHKILVFYIANIKETPDEAASKRKIGMCTLKCFVLNGVIFLGSILFFEYVVMPVIHVFRAYLDEGNASSSSVADSFVESLVYLLYQTFWTIPIYVLSFILNAIWYQEIAEKSYAQQFGRTKPPPIKVSEEIFRILLSASLAVQTLLIAMLPYIGKPLAFLYSSWAFSLYCFDYKWTQYGWGVLKRLDFLESNWAFFAGFGAPCTLATFFFPTFINLGLYALLFPLFVLLAVRSGPQVERPDIEPMACGKFPIFKQAQWCGLAIITAIFGDKYSDFQKQQREKKEKLERRQNEEQKQSQSRTKRQNKVAGGGKGQ